MERDASAISGGGGRCDDDMLLYYLFIFSRLKRLYIARSGSY